MKKILIIIAVIISIIIVNKGDDIILIPKESIRFRVIASSNTIEDQTIKNNISLKLSEYITNIVKSAQNKEEASDIIYENKDNIDAYIDNYFKENNINESYNLSIGLNYFPEKNYKGVKYLSGYYDSIVLEIGSKQGLNWWCVMYPPLCLIDENTEDVEYTSLISEILESY